jgi:nitrogen fixation NifU-like protein
VTEVLAFVRRFKHMMTLSEGDGEVDQSINLGDIEALQGVVKFPVRIKCATLGWNTLLEAITEASK